MKTSLPQLKVVQVITGLGTGGSERLVLDMHATFNRSRFDVRLVSISNELKALEAYGYRDVPITVFDMAANRISRLFNLRKYMKDVRPDIVHAHMFHALAAVCVACIGLHNRPKIVFTSHRSRFPYIRSLIIKILISSRDADVIFSYGQHPELNSANIYVIPNGSFISRIAPARKLWNIGGTVNFVAVGRIVDVKDPLGLLHSFAKADLPNASLSFVGEGSMLEEARALTLSLNLADRVIFHGLRSDIGRILAEADVFVMHSKHEGMPMALLEAAAQAMPVISTPVGAVPSVLGADRGILAEPQSFAAALRRLADDPLSALEMGHRLHRHALDHYSITSTTAAHERLYEMLTCCNDIQ